MHNTHGADHGPFDIGPATRSRQHIRIYYYNIYMIFERVCCVYIYKYFTLSRPTSFRFVVEPKMCHIHENYDRPPL